MSATAALFTAIQERLTGQDSHGQPLSHNGSDVEVVVGTGGSESPHVIIQRPRVRGTKFIDGASRKEIRQQLMIHTSFPSGTGDYALAYDVAEAVQQHLEAAPLTAQERTLHIPEGDRQPLPRQEREGSDTLDLTLSYRFYL